MHSLSRRLRCLLAAGSVALLVGGCSGSSTPTTAPTGSTGPVGAPGVSAKQGYLDKVNSLCDKLLPRVLRVTHGGSIDIPVRQYLRDWPAHRRVLAAFDSSLTAVRVPAAAAPAAAAMRRYVRFADKLDAARLEAARHGEQAWRREVAAEANVVNDPAIAARDAAGFASSCDAR